MEIALHTCRIDKKVPIAPTHKEQAVRMGDQTRACNALVGLCAVSADPVKEGDEKQHVLEDPHVNHDVLMHRVARRVRDKRLLHVLISQVLIGRVQV